MHGSSRVAMCDTHSQAAKLPAGRLDDNGKRQDSRAYSLYPNGDSYFGSYAADDREGLGLYAIAAGGAHAGLWSAAKRAGKGMMLMPDNALYTGGFQADKFDGWGTYNYPAGSTYTGGWKGGKKHGQVRMAFWCQQSSVLAVSKLISPCAADDVAGCSSGDRIH